MVDGTLNSFKRNTPTPRVLSLEDFRHQYVKRVFDFLGHDERKTASVLGVDKDEFTGISKPHPA